MPHATSGKALQPRPHRTLGQSDGVRISALVSTMHGPSQQDQLPVHAHEPAGRQDHAAEHHDHGDERENQRGGLGVGG